MRRSCIIPAGMIGLALLLAPASDSAETKGPLTLDGLLQAALAHDGRVLAAHAQLEAYRARYQEASWLWFPAAKLDILFGAPVGERRLACSGDPNCVRLKHPDPTSMGDLSGAVGFAVGGRLEASVPLYTFGKLSGAKRAAGAGVKAAEADIERARQEVALEVRRAYYGFLLADCTVEILEEGEEKLQEAEKKLLKMLEELNEEVTDTDLFKLRYYTAQVKSMLLQARQGQKVALAALRFLSGIESLGKEQPLEEAELKAPIEKLKPRDAYLTQAKKLRPELLQLASAVEAASATVDVQQASLYPDLFFGGYLSGSYSPVQDLIENPLLVRGLTYYDWGLSLGLRMTLDIPQKVARLDRARAELSRIRTQAAQAEQAAGLEIDRQLEELLAASENLKILGKGERAAKAWMRANFMSYGVGISNTKDLLDSLAADAKARLELHRAHHDTLVAFDRLRSMVGENLARSP